MEDWRWPGERRGGNFDQCKEPGGGRRGGGGEQENGDDFPAAGPMRDSIVISVR